MKHINQVEVRLPEDSNEFLENATSCVERCVSVGGLAKDLGLLEGTTLPTTPETKLQLEVAARLRIARERAGLTSGQADKLLSLEQGSVLKIETSARSLTVEELPKLAKTYGVDVAWLIEPNASTPQRPRLALAARELGKLKEEDLERVIALLSSLRSGEEGVK
jgi:transcriptional regulator with XRE-family HTH domain